MAATTENRRLRIAISGGGLAGVTLINALIKHPHLDVRIYELAAEFSEQGAAVGLAVNAQAALSEIGSEVREALDKAGAVSMNSTRAIIVRLEVNLRI
jgi:salicylate hydroxylase